MLRVIITFVLALSFVFGTASVGIRAQGVVISEIMALNDGTLNDEDGDFPDWIEIYNAGSSDVNLEGWTLTDDADDLRKWEFPAKVLAPHEVLVVFASGKDRRAASRELHTNFKLTSRGEFLALVDPLSRVMSLFAPAYPQQIVDASYGSAMPIVTSTLLSSGSSTRYHVPTSSELGSTWTFDEFDDESWADGSLAVGYDAKETPGLTDLIRTDVSLDLRSVNSSMYLRTTFDLVEGNVPRYAQLRVKYDDGFVAYVNGVRVARANASIVTFYNSRATAARDDVQAREEEVFPIPDAASILHPGTNTLAVQVLNRTADDPDLLFVAEIEDVTVPEIHTVPPVFFESPTPRWPNGTGVPGVAAAPEFSRPSGAIVTPFDLELTAPGEGAEIRYTVNGTAPTRSSTLYTGPITVNRTMAVKAMTFQPGMLHSLPATGSYLMIHSSLANYSSTIPIILVNTFGSSIQPTSAPSGVYTPMHFHVIERGEDGVARITDEPNFSGNGGIKERGSSTGGRDKVSYRMELWNERREDFDAPVLGLPAESDWILYGAYNFDRTHIRNAFIYELSNQVGRYAVRTRFCELFVNTSASAPVGSSGVHFRGIYTFMEKIKRTPSRLNLDRLLPEHTSEPEISGGYIIKQDRADPQEPTFSAMGRSLVNVEPSSREIAPAQRSWLISYLGFVQRSLSDPNPQTGYPLYIDELSWIDHNILNLLPMNVDAFRLSGYMFKDREGRLEMGPVWDFDRSMGSTDGRDDNPTTWYGTGDSSKFLYSDSRHPWWGVLSGGSPYGSTAFMQRYKVRWKELRLGPLSNENISKVIDDMALEIKDSVPRDAQRWRQVTGLSHWQQEITLMKNWLVTRANWIDTQFVVPPQLSPFPGIVPKGTRVTITAFEGDAYYTLDGTDPRGRDGNPSAEAVLYSGPIVVEENTRIKTRARLSATKWTEITEGAYITDPLPLRVTELLYKPSSDPNGTYGATDFEFIELQNIGNEPIDLTGVRFVYPGLPTPRFEFREGESLPLGPGDHTVLVYDTAAFRSRYGDSVRVDGEFDRSLSNYQQIIKIEGPYEEVIQEFRYLHEWYPEEADAGHSIVIRDPHGPLEMWDQADGWRPSLEPHGSPGRIDASVAGYQTPGDFSQDGELDITDVVQLLRHLFLGESSRPCFTDGGFNALMDVDGEEGVNASDALYILHFFYQGGPAPVMGRHCLPIDGCAEACAPAR